MIVTVVNMGDTRHYVKYESPDMDFSNSGIKIRMWIPKTEFQTNVPGVYPEAIALKILDDAEVVDGTDT